MWQLEDVEVRFDSTAALIDATLTIEDGEIVVILGPSGCGKSTLLRVLAGLQPVDRGCVLIDGIDAAGRPPHLRGIGVMFQDPTLFPHRTVGENVAFGLRMAGVARAPRARRVEEMLDLVGLAGLADRTVDNLSGGEAQRVALARALAPSPRLLLLDEPLAALDRGLRDRLVAELPALLSATDTTAVHVTHNHDEAFAIADRIAVMDQGRILRVDTPPALFADPRTEDVARFLGHTNLIGEGIDRRAIRRDAATIDPNGELAATVIESRFLGDHHDVVVTTELGILRFRLTESVEVGMSTRLRIDAGRVAAITPS